jgi:hypothetical protein
VLLLLLRAPAPSSAAPASGSCVVGASSSCRSGLKPGQRRHCQAFPHSPEQSPLKLQWFGAVRDCCPDRRRAGAHCTLIASPCGATAPTTPCHSSDCHAHHLLSPRRTPRSKYRPRYLHWSLGHTAQVYNHISAEERQDQQDRCDSEAKQRGQWREGRSQREAAAGPCRCTPRAAYVDAVVGSRGFRGRRGMGGL